MKMARSMLWSVIRITLAVYVLGVGFLWWNQRALLYLPRAITMERSLQIAGEFGLKSWVGPINQHLGFHAPARGAARGAILFFHGNAGFAAQSGAFALPAVERGYDFYALEYPGYAARPGRPTQETLVAAALEAFDLVRARTAPELPVFLLGESLGTGVAAQVAQQRGAGVDGLILALPFNSVAAVAKRNFPIVPVDLILKDRFDSTAALRDYRGPVFVALAEYDATVPPEFGLALYDSYYGSKRLRVFGGIDHWGTFLAGQPQFWNESLDFVRQTQK